MQNNLTSLPQGTEQQLQQTNSGQNLDWKRLASILDTKSKLGLCREITLTEALAVASQPIPRRCSGDEALAFAEFMGKAMPTGQGTDFDIWVKDAAIIFSEYAESDVKITVEHPIKGIRATQKWLPQPCELIEFLNAMRERRGRIIGNARYIIAERTKPVEIEEIPERRAMIARRMENLVREFKGLRSLEAVEQTREQQAAFDAECVAAGDGDKLAGLMILLDGKSQPFNDDTATIPKSMQSEISQSELDASVTKPCKPLQHIPNYGIQSNKANATFGQ